MPPDSQMTTLETFGPDLADCHLCRQQGACRERRFATSFVGPKYKPGGMLIVGDMPVSRDVQLGRAFAGRPGELLFALLESAGIDPDTVWYTNALLGAPPREFGTKAEKAETKLALAQDLYACQPRLIAEIEYARPRVIVTLGQAGLDALTSEEVQKTKLVPIECEHCDPVDRKIGPFMVCANGTCKRRERVPENLIAWHETRRAHLEALVDEYYTNALNADALGAFDRNVEAELDEDDEYQARLRALESHVAGAEDLTACWRRWWLEQHANACPACQSSMSRIRPKRIACDACGGKKKRQETETLFVRRYGLTGREGAVGAVIEAPGLEDLGVKYIIPTYAPWALLMPMRDGANKGGALQFGQYAARPAVDHLAKARKLLARDAVFAVEVATTHGMTHADAAATLDDYTREAGAYSVDIETDSMDGPWSVTNITCIGINLVEWDECLVVDTRAIGSTWHPGDPLYESLMRFLEDASKTKVFWNGPYDLVVMRRLWGVVVEGVECDGMLAHYACYPDEEHNLGFVAHELTDAPMWKGGGDVTKAQFEKNAHLSGYRTFHELALYNARDVRATSYIRDTLIGYDGKTHGRVDHENVRAVFDADMFNQGICVDMEINGMPLSTAHLRAVEETRSLECAMLLSDMRKFLGEVPGDVLGKNDAWRPTGKMLQWALYDPAGPLRLPIVKATTKGGSTDKDTLTQFVHLPFVQTLMKYNKEEYNLSHFVRSDALQVREDGRLHPQWKCHGARTGRWTSFPNMQNWPKWMREAFRAPKGRKLVGADQSQLEMRIIAALSGDEGLIHRCATANEKDKLNPDCDPHSYMASKTFGEAFTKKNKADPNHFKAAPGQRPCRCETCQRGLLRDIVKRVVYGLNYGAGAATVLEAIYDGGYDGPALDVHEIERVTAVYFREFPGVPNWRNRTLAEVTENREVRSPIYGRRRIFPLGVVEPSVVYNYPIQSGGSDIMTYGLRRFYPRLRDIDPTAVLVAQVHDAIYVEADENRARAVADLITETMSNELVLAKGAPAMPFVMTAKIGDDWASLS